MTSVPDSPSQKQPLTLSCRVIPSRWAWVLQHVHDSMFFSHPAVLISCPAQQVSAYVNPSSGIWNWLYFSQLTIRGQAWKIRGENQFSLLLVLSRKGMQGLTMKVILLVYLNLDIFWEHKVWGGNVCVLLELIKISGNSFKRDFYRDAAARIRTWHCSSVQLRTAQELGLFQKFLPTSEWFNVFQHTHTFMLHTSLEENLSRSAFPRKWEETIYRARRGQASHSHRHIQCVVCW